MLPATSANIPSNTVSLVENRLRAVPANDCRQLKESTSSFGYAMNKKRGPTMTTVSQNCPRSRAKQCTIAIPVRQVRAKRQRDWEKNNPS